jgi:hypothetical protein
MEWVARTRHTTSERGVSSITTADSHNSAASSRLNCRPRRFKWTRPFRRKTKSGFCACAITFQTQSTNTEHVLPNQLAYFSTNSIVNLLERNPRKWAVNITRTVRMFYIAFKLNPKKLF